MQPYPKVSNSTQQVPFIFLKVRVIKHIKGRIGCTSFEHHKM